MSAKTNKRREETSCAHFNKTWMLGKYAMSTLILVITYDIIVVDNFLNFVNIFFSYSISIFTFPRQYKVLSNVILIHYLKNKLC